MDVQQEYHMLASSIFPDLRYAAALNAEALFKAIVIDSALQNNGMVAFADQLTPEDAEAIGAMW